MNPKWSCWRLETLNFVSSFFSLNIGWYCFMPHLSFVNNHKVLRWCIASISCLVSLFGCGPAASFCFSSIVYDVVVFVIGVVYLSYVLSRWLLVYPPCARRHAGSSLELQLLLPLLFFTRCCNLHLNDPCSVIIVTHRTIIIHGTPSINHHYHPLSMDV